MVHTDGYMEQHRVLQMQIDCRSACYSKIADWSLAMITGDRGHAVVHLNNLICGLVDGRIQVSRVAHPVRWCWIQAYLPTGQICQAVLLVNNKRQLRSLRLRGAELRQYDSLREEMLIQEGVMKQEWKVCRRFVEQVDGQRR